MNFFSTENISFAVGIAGLVGSLPAYRGYLLGASVIKGSWQLKRLRRELELLNKLNDSKHELTYFFAVSVLVPVALLGVSLVFHAAASLPTDGNLGPLSDWVIGSSVYLFCAYRVGKFNRLRHFDVNVQRLQAAIEKVEAKNQRNNDRR